MGYWWEGHKERDYQENQDVGGWIILKWILRDRMRWIDMTQDRDEWKALLDTVINLRVP
jgi:hypothetical protein